MLTRAGQAHTHLSEFEQAEQALNRARVVLERSRTLPDHAFYLATCLNDLVSISTRILGRRTAPFPGFLVPQRVPHGFTPRS